MSVARTVLLKVSDNQWLRENGTRNYLWWAYERLEDLRPLLSAS